jgi:hypothetical protein
MKMYVLVVKSCFHLFPYTAYKFWPCIIYPAQVNAIDIKSQTTKQIDDGKTGTVDKRVVTHTASNDEFSTDLLCGPASSWGDPVKEKLKFTDV